MLSIEKINKSDIRDSQYKKQHDENNLYLVKENDKPIAYVTFIITNQTMWLYMIEVIEKGKGLGTKIIKHLIEHFSLKKITGFILCEERAYHFWESLGADIYYITEEGYSIEELLDAQLESPFTLVLN